MGMKRVLITGGNKGIGLELSRDFLNLGYEVIVVARDFSCFEFHDHPQITEVVFDLCNVDKIDALVGN